MQLDFFSQPQNEILHEHEKSVSGKVILNANQKQLKGQNKSVLDALIRGEHITLFDNQRLQVGILNSRISDVRCYLKVNHNITIQQERINIKGTSCYSYWINDTMA